MNQLRLATNVNPGMEKDCPFDISKVNAKYNSKFVGTFCLRDVNDNWANQPVWVFWQPTPPQPEYSHYFALFVRDGRLYITSGASAVAEDIDAVRAANGDIIYSTHRHDYRGSADGSVWIDGGRDYTRRGTPSETVMLRVVDGDFYEVLPSISTQPEAV